MRILLGAVAGLVVSVGSPATFLWLIIQDTRAGNFDVFWSWQTLWTFVQDLMLATLLLPFYWGHVLLTDGFP